MTFWVFVGWTTTKGSTSELTKFVPGPPIVQAANGLGLEAFTGGSAAYVPPMATAAIERAAVARRAPSIRRIADLLPSGARPRYICPIDQLPNATRREREFVSVGAGL